MYQKHAGIQVYDFLEILNEITNESADYPGFLTIHALYASHLLRGRAKTTYIRTYPGTTYTIMHTYTKVAADNCVKCWTYMYVHTIPPLSCMYISMK